MYANIYIYTFTNKSKLTSGGIVTYINNIQVNSDYKFKSKLTPYMVTLTLLASALHELLKTSGSLQIQVLCNDINVATLCNKTLNTYLQYCTSKNGRCAFSECNNSVRKFIQYITEDIRIIKTYSKTIEDILDLLSTITPLLIRDELISISAQMSKASKNKIKHPDKKYVQLSDMIVSAVFEQNKQIN